MPDDSNSTPIINESARELCDRLIRELGEKIRKRLREELARASDNPNSTPVSVAQHEDFTVAYYEGGRFRLCLDTADPSKIPKFRDAIDCVEAILKLPTYPRQTDDVDGEWAE